MISVVCRDFLSLCHRLSLIRNSSSSLSPVYYLTLDAHHTMFRKGILGVRQLTHLTTDRFTHTPHTHTHNYNVQLCNLQPSGTLNTHTHAILRAVPVFSLKKVQETPLL